MRVLGLGTFSITPAIHGGQRRIAAIAKHYAENGIDYVYRFAAAKGAPDPSADGGVSTRPISGPIGRLPLAEDLNAGQFAARNEEAYAFFASEFARFKPDAVQLEQPFLWPIVKRALSEGDLSAKVVYSSQNFEAELKADLYILCGQGYSAANEVYGLIADVEADLMRSSDLVVSVSKADQFAFRRLGYSGRIILAPNGSDEVTPTGSSGLSMLPAELRGHPYAAFVGSAYPPNVEGFKRLALEGGLHCLSDKALAICGGCSESIFGSNEYLSNIEAYSRRVHFYPDLCDEMLSSILRGAHTVILPISHGGGSNIKTAEALMSGKWVVATSKALRSFEPFAKAKGVLVADTPAAFMDAVAYSLRQPPLKLGARELKARMRLSWSSTLASADLAGAVLGLQRARERPGLQASRG